MPAKDVQELLELDVQEFEVTEPAAQSIPRTITTCAIC